MDRMQANVWRNRGRGVDESMSHELGWEVNNVQLASGCIGTVARRASYPVPGAVRAWCFCIRGAMFWYADLAGLSSKRVSVGKGNDIYRPVSRWQYYLDSNKSFSLIILLPFFS